MWLNVQHKLCSVLVLFQLLYFMKMAMCLNNFPFGMDGRGSEYKIYLTLEAICPKPNIFWNVY